MNAKGIFEVKLAPLDSYAKGSEGRTVGRMSIDKTFAGDLEATSKGEMLSVRTPVKGSAGYVAIEEVQGVLGGKTGTFALQHFGIMAGADQRLVLEVIPDSGTGGLVGLSGSMTIKIEDGKHLYGFTYEIG